jgi:hypothetical protein
MLKPQIYSPGEEVKVMSMTILQSVFVAFFCMFVVFTVLIALWISIVLFNVLLRALAGGGRQGGHPDQAQR